MHNFWMISHIYLEVLVIILIRENKIPSYQTEYI